MICNRVQRTTPAGEYDVSVRSCHWHRGRPVGDAIRHEPCKQVARHSPNDREIHESTIRERACRSTPLAAARGRSDRPVASGRRPLTLLLVALWIGLAAGFLDLGFTGPQEAPDRRRRLLPPGRWLPLDHPRGGRGLVLLPGAVLALVGPVAGRGGASRARRGAPLVRRVPRPLCPPAAGATGRRCCCPRGSRSSPPAWSAPRRRGFLRFVRLTAPLLAGAVLILAAATSGVRAWSEHRAAAALPPPPPAARNVLLIVWDTVRARNLSLYGYGRRTTPNLERLAARGVQFRHAFATSSWTLPSHASLFTGTVAPRALGRLEDAARRHPSHARRPAQLPRL